jgi:CheY-like chemotaxis protein
MGNQTLRGIRIVVVEDDGDNRDMLGIVFSHHGAVVTAAATAHEALALAPSADIMVTDFVLPDEDAAWLVEQVQRGERPIPVIVVSGFTGAQVPRLAQAGFARTVLKPVDPLKLAEIVRDVLEAARQAEV